MSADILVVGSLNMDLVVYTPRHPSAGETLLGTSFATYPGGKGANQAIAAARLGASVQMIGCVGQDDFGSELIRNLTANGVDATHVLRAGDARSGTALITVDSQGENRIIVVPGANHRLAPADLDHLESVFAQAKILVLQMEIPLPTIQRAVELAKQRRLRVVLNPAPAQAIPSELLEKVDFLIPNEGELSILTGLPTDTAESVRRSAVLLRDLGVARVLVTRGAQGIYYISQDEEFWLSAYPVHAVDTTAAGDAFIGGFAAALARGQSIREASLVGCAAGAIAATRPGAQPSLPTLSEVETFMKENS